MFSSSSPPSHDHSLLERVLPVLVHGQCMPGVGHVVTHITCNSSSGNMVSFHVALQDIPPLAKLPTSQALEAGAISAASDHGFQDKIKLWNEESLSSIKRSVRRHELVKVLCVFL